jgi:hypothetical protein
MFLSYQAETIGGSARLTIGKAHPVLHSTWHIRMGTGTSIGKSLRSPLCSGNGNSGTLKASDRVADAIPSDACDGPEINRVKEIMHVAQINNRSVRHCAQAVVLRLGRVNRFIGT